MAGDEAFVKERFAFGAGHEGVELVTPGAPGGMEEDHDLFVRGCGLGAGLFDDLVGGGWGGVLFSLGYENLLRGGDDAGTIGKTEEIDAGLNSLDVHGEMVFVGGLGCN